MLILLRFVVVLAVVAISSSAVAARDAWRMCDGCSTSQMAQCAVQAAGSHNFVTGDHVWIHDFQNEFTLKYYMQVTPPGTIIQGDGKIDLQDDSQIQSITPIQSSLSPDEAQFTSLLMFFVNDIWRLQGAGYNYPSCGSNFSSDGGDLTGVGARSGAVVVHPIQIPPGAGQNTAYDVFGFLASASQLASAHAGLTGALGFVQSFWSSFVPISPFNMNTQLKLLFDDGSYGIWKFNFQSDQWEAGWSTFRDSEGNPIPLTPSDMVGQGYDFSATLIGQNSLGNFLNRARILGIPITGPGGGDEGPVPTRCRMEGDRLKCWPVGQY